MNVLVCVSAYEQDHVLRWWARAWHASERYGDARLAVVHNYEGQAPPAQQYELIASLGPDAYIPRRAPGYEVGALRDAIRDRSLDPWDVIFFATEDNVPVRRDFLRAFCAPFEHEPNLGLVGNYWVKGSFYGKYSRPVPDHFRASCVALSRKAATGLYFPRPLETRADCHRFEWADGEMNMTAQVSRMGLDARPVSGDWDLPWVDANDYAWDVGVLNSSSPDPRCRKDRWATYMSQFGGVAR